MGNITEVLGKIKYSWNKNTEQ